MGIEGAEGVDNSFSRSSRFAKVAIAQHYSEVYPSLRKSMECRATAECVGALAALREANVSSAFPDFERRV
jgi:hypothetical protein